jgi:hypothetical protein
MTVGELREHLKGIPGHYLIWMEVGSEDGWGGRTYSGWANNFEMCRVGGENIHLTEFKKKRAKKKKKDKTELNPCANCGSGSVHVAERGSIKEGREYRVVCGQCGTHTFWHPHNWDHQYHIEEWNKFNGNMHCGSC